MSIINDNLHAYGTHPLIYLVNKALKGKPAKDNDNETNNPKDIADKDLPIKKDNGTKDIKKVSVEVAEKLRKHSMQDVESKAKLSVELAAQQQFKGLIPDPLREALLKNMKEAGVADDVADAIVHNAYLDGFEETHKVLRKEAFETFMAKDINDFVEVSKFVKAYQVDDLASVKNAEVDTKVASDDASEGSREKTASTVPLRGSKVSDVNKDSYKKFWQTVDRERRGF